MKTRATEYSTEINKVVALSTLEPGNLILTTTKSLAWMFGSNTQKLAVITSVEQEELNYKVISASNELEAFLTIEQRSESEQEVFAQNAYDYDEVVANELDKMKRDNTIVITNDYIKLVYDCAAFNSKKDEIKKSGAKWDKVNKVWTIKATDKLVKSLSSYFNTIIDDRREQVEQVEQVEQTEKQQQKSELDSVVQLTKHSKHESVSDEEQLEAIEYCKNNNIKVDTFGDYHYEMMHDL